MIEFFLYDYRESSQRWAQIYEENPRIRRPGDLEQRNRNLSGARNAANIDPALPETNLSSQLRRLDEVRVQLQTQVVQAASDTCHSGIL